MASLVLAPAVGCRRTQRAAAVANASRPAEHASRSPIADAAAVAMPVPPTPPPPLPPPADVDLLRATEAVVIVSSVVANNTDRASNLVDGDPTTVWSSATGEMTRTWFEAVLPPDAQVHAIEMTAGYTRGGPDRPDAGRDLFTANVRITRIRVEHDNTTVGEFPLDPNVRTLQRVPVQGTGGIWRVEAIGLQRGSQPAWREVSVSELRVEGVPGVRGRREVPRSPNVLVDWGIDSFDLTVDAALQDARRNLLGDGLNIENDEYGCQGANATGCVRRMWIAVADAGIILAHARCGPSDLTAYRQHYRTLQRLHERQGALIENDGDYDSIDPPADAAQEHLYEEARAIFDACTADPRLHDLGVLLGDPTALGSFHWQP